VRLLMCLVIGLAFISPPSLGQSGDGDVALKSVRRLVGLFRNCHFSGSIAVDDMRVGDLDYRQRLRIAAWICDQATLVRWTNHIEIFSEDKVIGRDEPSSEQDESDEWRRIGDGPMLDSNVEVLNPSRWPKEHQNGRAAVVQHLLDYSPDVRSWGVAWEGKLVGEFLHGLNGYSGITIEDLVTNGGRLGFHEDSSAFTSNAKEPSRIHRFRSDLYGTCDVTFTEVDGSWMPTRIVLVQSAGNRIEAPDPATGRPVSSADGKCLRVSDLPLREDASAPGVDRMETTYAISYENMPTKIEKTVVMDYGGKPYTSTWKLVFSNFQSGHVTRADVETAAIPIPNGTKVHTNIRQNSRIRHEYRDGKVVRATDVTSINIAESARFSTSRKIALLTTSIIVAALAILLLYRRALRG